MRSGSCLLQQMPATRPSSSLGRTISMLLPVVVPLVLLTAIAFANPLDPSWMAGVYDGGDGDDIVSLVYDATAANTAARPHIAPFPCRSDAWLASAIPCSPGDRLARSSRSPPFVFCGVRSCPQVSAIPRPPRSPHSSTQPRASSQIHDGATSTKRFGSVAEGNHVPG